MTDDNLSLPPGLAVAWGIITRGRRGPKPAHSIEEIVQAAVELADADGIAALSLPRLAARVGVTTNALYRYISSKDELLVLARDAGWGLPPKSILADAATWREAATAWTGAVIDRYAARPWLLDVPVPGAPVTPCLLRWLENLLESMAGTGLSHREMLACALLLDGYAYSTASLARSLRAANDQPGQYAGVYEFLLPRLTEHGFPVLASALSAGAYGSGDGFTDTHLTFGLTRILDGIEALIRTRR